MPPTKALFQRSKKASQEVMAFAVHTQEKEKKKPVSRRITIFYKKNIDFYNNKTSQCKATRRRDSMPFENEKPDALRSMIRLKEFMQAVERKKC